MSHVKAAGGKVAQQSQRKRHGKRLGVKMSGGSKITVGQIIIRQRGLTYKPGKNVGVGRDHTIFAMQDGTVTFSKHFGKTVVNVL